VTDTLEAIANATTGLAVSAALVLALRATGLWDAHWAVVTGIFFTASVGRSYALRRLFRAWEGRNA